MKLDGFVNGAYTLDSVNVDAQRCVNLYPEAIESGTGKGANAGYLRNTPGLDLFKDIGSGPIREIHRDSMGRYLIISGAELYRVTENSLWSFQVKASGYSSPVVIQSSGVNTTTDIFTSSSQVTMVTGSKVQVSSTGTLPTGLSASTDYFIIYLTAFTFQLATSLANALAGTFIDVTAAGSGNMTAEDQTPDFVFTDILYNTDVDFTLNQITSTAHGYYDGTRVVFSALGTPLPGGLDYLINSVGGSSVYYAKVIDANNFSLCTSMFNVNANTVIDLTKDNTESYYVGQLATFSYIDPSYAPAVLTTSTGVVNVRSSNTDATKPNGTTIFCDGSEYYLLFFDDVTLNTFEFGQAAGYEYPDQPVSSTHVAWIDGYYILNEINSGKFWVTGLNDVTVDPLSFASSEGSPDNIVGLIENSRDLWVFNEKSLEVFVNTGNPDFPFERVQSGFIEHGCAAKYSINKVENVIFWIGRTESGQGVVYMASGMQPQRISTYPIEQAINGYADMTTATSYTYQENGHKFYVLTFAEATWVYDMSTGVWHERAFTTAGVLGRQLGENHCLDNEQNLHLIGSYTDGKVYSYNDSTYTDNTALITRLRTLPHFSNENFLIFWQELWLDMQTGIGLVSGQGSDPQVMLDWSDDGGHTWSDESWTSAGGQSGGIGEYSTRVRWRRLGKSRDRIFRFKITDPVKTILIAAYAKLKQGFS